MLTMMIADVFKRKRRISYRSATSSSDNYLVSPECEGKTDDRAGAEVIGLWRTAPVRLISRM